MHARRMLALALVLMSAGALLTSRCKADETIADFGIGGEDIP